MTNMHQKSSSLNSMAVVAAFLLPLLIAGGLYMTRELWHFKSDQHGQLLNPMIELQTLSLSLPSGKPFLFTREPAQWRLVFVADNCAKQTCELPLAKLESIRQATGKDFPRVSSVLITRLPELNHEPAENFHDLSWLLLPAQSTLENGLFIADPNGNLILYYPTQTQAQDILEDLRHLLKISQIG